MLIKLPHLPRSIDVECDDREVREVEEEGRDNVEIKEEMKGKIYILYDWIDDKVIMAGFDKTLLLAKVGQDAMTGVDINSYCLESVFLSDLNDEYL